MNDRDFRNMGLQRGEWGGEEPEQVHSTISVTPGLCADERAFAAFIGRDLREMLLAGKTVVVKMVRS